MGNQNPYITPWRSAFLQFHHRTKTPHTLGSGKNEAWENSPQNFFDACLVYVLHTSEAGKGNKHKSQYKVKNCKFSTQQHISFYQLELDIATTMSRQLETHKRLWSIVTRFDSSRMHIRWWNTIAIARGTAIRARLDQQFIVSHSHWPAPETPMAQSIGGQIWEIC